MNEPTDPELQALQTELKETEELNGAESLQTFYVLEDLLPLLQKRKRFLEAANLKARIKVLRKKLNLSDEESTWKPLSKQQERSRLL